MSVNAEILLVHLEGFYSSISMFIGGKVSHVFWCQGKAVLPKQFKFGGKITGLAISEEFHQDLDLENEASMLRNLLVDKGKHIYL